MSMTSSPGNPTPPAVTIEKRPFDAQVYDVMGGDGRWEVKVHDHGLVALLDVMPRLVPVGKTADFAIVQAARVSYGSGTKMVNEDRGLIRYLARHRHSTPFEMIEWKFHHVMPIFIARQWIRHRTACLAGDARLSFDLPGAARRGSGRQHYPMTIERLHRLWHAGAEPVRVGKRKPTAVERVDRDRQYAIPELARTVGRREETLRNMVRDGSLVGTKSDGRITVSGQAWRDWAERSATIRVPMRDRAARMRLRMCDEQTGEIRHTHVTDVWESGVKPVFRVTLQNGYALTMTRDHRCLTDRGWMTLGEATGLRLTGTGGVTWDDRGPALAVNGEPAHRSATWLGERKAQGWDVRRMADAAGVSYPAVRQNLRRFGLSFTPAERAALSGRTQRGSRRSFRRAPLGEQWRANVRAARSGPRSNFWKGGVTSERANAGRWTTEHAQAVHRRNGFACVLCGSKARLAAHHVDPVWHNASLSRDEGNLTSLCGRCHARLHAKNLDLALLEHLRDQRPASEFWATHRNARPRPLGKRLPKPRLLVRGWSRVARIEYVGERMTYDLSVAGPFHNFVANGFVVHNSVNEYSARYSVVRDRYYRPDIANVRAQSASNRQGGEGPIDQLTAEQFLAHLDAVEQQHATYEKLLASGVSRELARIALPVSVYTEWYWKIDLHNLFHFLSLRMDPHAQQEIRDYANAMFALIQPIVPIAAEAFLDYNFQSLHLSRLEVEAMRTGRPLASENKRENAEWEAKKSKLGLSQPGV